MSDCSKHKKDVAGVSDMKLLAEMIGDLHYESLNQLFIHLSNKLWKDGCKDSVNDKSKLGDHLKSASISIDNVRMDIEQAWEISKPFMTNNHPFGDMVKNSAYQAKDLKK